MRKIIIVSFFIFAILSCDKSTDSLIHRYTSLYGTWKTQSMSYDSSGVSVTRSLRYDRLVINEDMTYKIFYDSVNNIENGILRIVTQTDSKLELFFEAHYPDYSSFAGSHIFAHSPVFVVSLTKNELVLQDIEEGYFPAREFHFIRL